MKFGISNIAWEPALDIEVAKLLTRLDVNFVDVAPSKYFDLSKEADLSEVANIRQRWENSGLPIRGMQALMYGSTLNLFGPPIEQEDMLKWLERVCIFADLLGATYLVFGSPKNRKRGSLPIDLAGQMALEFFCRLGKIAERYGKIICLEPNPPDYGSDFLVTVEETTEFVDELNHPNIKMQLDSGALAMDHENPESIRRVPEFLVGHLHLSSPNLAPLHLAAETTASYMRLALQAAPHRPPAIEMLTSRPELALSEIEKSIKFVKELFYPEGGANT
jgi:sugar phosphate isomerase/epimerase